MSRNASSRPDPLLQTNLPSMLKEWRRSNGHSLVSAARRLGVCAAAWGHWETEVRFPSPQRLSELAQLTGISVCRLLCPYATSLCDQEHQKSTIRQESGADGELCRIYPR